jgi:D-alanyl-D-alanine carboxypeptidase/D-alanyl-D-alanine-endopeptidase (penicillin-binding protein 4)
VVTAATPQPNSSVPADPSRIAAKIAAIKPAAGTVGAVSVDLASGRTLYSKNADALLIPASNLKSLTGIALLDAVDAGTRFATKVVSADSSTPSPAASPRAITLVGGGDPYLLSVPSTTFPQFASTQNLARSTAAALKRQGVTAVTLGYDDSLFTGPNWNPTWQADYADQVTHVSALWVDEGLPAGATARSTTPALQAAQVFAGQLRADGITVSGTPTATTAASSASTLASVSSAPVEDLLKRALLSSDNSATEVLSHQMALASGQPATFAGACHRSPAAPDQDGRLAVRGRHQGRLRAVPRQPGERHHAGARVAIRAAHPAHPADRRPGPGLRRLRLSDGALPGA